MVKGNRRFGDYLKSLRSDRRLTLERIEELSARLGEPVTKTYLSRCEHGQTHPTLPKLEALARIFKIRLGELAEMFELEQELLRRPASVTESSLEAAELAERAMAAAARGDSQGALILFDAARGLTPGAARIVASSLADEAAEAPAAPPAAVADPEGSAPAADAERVASARSRLCLAVVSASLGNHRVCKEEAESLLCTDDLPDELRLRAAIQLAHSYRHLRRGALARLVVADLLAKGEALPLRIQADAHFLMGCLDIDADSPRPALLHLRKAVSLYRGSEAAPDLCRCLLELGEAYRLCGQLPEAMVRYQDALVIARRCDIKLLASDLLSLLGKGHSLLGNNAAALRHLFESNEIARRGDYFDILFRNYFYLRSIAKAQGDEFSQRTAERSLRSLIGRCDPLGDEVTQFRLEMSRRLHEASTARSGGERASEPADRANENSSGSEDGRAATEIPKPEVPPRYKLARQASDGVARRAPRSLESVKVDARIVTSRVRQTPR